MPIGERAKGVPLTIKNIGSTMSGDSLCPRARVYSIIGVSILWLFSANFAQIRLTFGRGSECRHNFAATTAGWSAHGQAAIAMMLTRVCRRLPPAASCGEAINAPVESSASLQRHGDGIEVFSYPLALVRSMKQGPPAGHHGGSVCGPGRAYLGVSLPRRGTSRQPPLLPSSRDDLRVPDDDGQHDSRRHGTSRDSFCAKNGFHGPPEGGEGIGFSRVPDGRTAEPAKTAKLAAVDLIEDGRS
jgi:hypothetical protein